MTGWTADSPMNIIILDDYQDAVRKLQCASKLDGLAAKVFTNTVKGTGQLAVRLRDAEALVLIRERTALTQPLLEKLPLLKLISQTGKVSGHVDVAAATARGSKPAGTRLGSRACWAGICSARAMRPLPSRNGMIFSAGCIVSRVSTPRASMKGSSEPTRSWW